FLCQQTEKLSHSAFPRTHGRFFNLCPSKAGVSAKPRFVSTQCLGETAVTARGERSKSLTLDCCAVIEAWTAGLRPARLHQEGFETGGHDVAKAMVGVRYGTAVPIGAGGGQHTG